MVKNFSLVIFILCMSFYGCDNQIMNVQEDSDDNLNEHYENSYYLDLESYLNIDENGYYEIWFLNGYVQTFTTLTAKTGSYDNYQKLYWETNRTFIIQFLNQDYETDLVNHHSYTDELGEAHTVFGPWGEFIGDTITVYASYEDQYYNNYIDSLKIIVRSGE